MILGLLAGIAGSAWARAALRYGLTALAILLFLLALRRSGETAKEEEPLRGALNPVLTPFLDALGLRGMDAAWLDEMRRRSADGELALFRDVNDRMLARSYPSKVWRAHFGTGAHISRSRVHTELGQLGSEGVEAALALEAQRDPRTAARYHGKAVDDARRRKGQDMIDALLEEAFE